MAARLDAWGATGFPKVARMRSSSTSWFRMTSASGTSAFTIMAVMVSRHSMWIVSSASMYYAGTLRCQEKEQDYASLTIMHVSNLQSSLLLACRICRSPACFRTDSEKICRRHSSNSSRVSLRLGTPARIR